MANNSTPQITNEEIRIRQRKDDCHYETIAEFGELTFIGYGHSQRIADTDCISKLLLKHRQEIVEEIEKMKYIDKDFIDKEENSMDTVAMRTKNLIIDEVLTKLKQTLHK